MTLKPTLLFHLRQFGQEESPVSGLPYRRSMLPMSLPRDGVQVLQISDGGQVDVLLSAVTLSFSHGLQLMNNMQAVSQVVRSLNDPVPAVRITGLSEGSRLGFLTQELSDGSLVIVSGLPIHDGLAAKEVRLAGERCAYLFGNFSSHSGLSGCHFFLQSLQHSLDDSR
ncbi:hypothetical protein EYF80_012104 [Liparis tanakae]|uniref:Uncharacterized protein n=1 Tax=Liparis tanakae TaxID=230148 RepID=A0A4Z2IIN3_9TELE|nr:hypothetical protein EYF80_012104 [Liparis tanakae]